MDAERPFHRSRFVIPLGGWLVLAFLLLAGVIALRLSPGLNRPAPVPQQHFYIVTATAAVSFVLALLIGKTAIETRDLRILALALGFLSLTAIFTVHGAATPGVFLNRQIESGAGSEYGAYGGAPSGAGAEYRGSIVGLSAFMSLWVGAAFFLLSRSPLPEVLRLRYRLGPLPPLVGWLAVLLAYGVTAFAFEEFYSRLPLSGPWLSWVVGGTTMLFLLLAAWRFHWSYSLTRLPMQGAMVVGLLFLVDAQVAMIISPAWTPSWWAYHVLMLGGFLVASGGLLLEYRRGRGLRRIMAGVFDLEGVVELELTYGETIAALAAATEAKDPQTKGHTVRVAELAVLLGKDLRLPNSRLRVLARAGLLHDIGKLGIPDDILCKEGKLTPEEFAVMKQHSMKGYEIAKRVPSLDDEAWLIRYHHERIDGAGYPDKVAAGTLPLEARTLMVADVYDSLRSDRPYRKGYDHAAALHILREEAKGHLDPQIVETLVRLAESGQVERFYSPQAKETALQVASSGARA